MLYLEQEKISISPVFFLPSVEIIYLPAYGDTTGAHFLASTANPVCPSNVMGGLTIK